MQRGPARIVVHPSSMRAAEPVPDPATLPVFRQVEEGHPAAIAQVTALVARIVQFRGFFIPLDDRPDVVHEGMVDLLRATAESRFVNDEQFFGFVRVIAYRRCIDWIRQKRRMDRVRGRSVEGVDPQEHLLCRERRELGTRVVRRLRKSCRDLFGMHAGLGLTYGQISDLLDRSEGALRTQAYDCLKQAKRVLGILRNRQVTAVARPRRGG